MNEPYKNKNVAMVATGIYDGLVIASCLTLFAMNIFMVAQYGAYSKQELLLFFPSIILIFHTLVVKVSRRDMFEKKNEDNEKAKEGQQ